MTAPPARRPDHDAEQRCRRAGEPSAAGRPAERSAQRRKRITSRIVARPVNSIVSRSIPSLSPPVGGIPYESARRSPGPPLALDLLRLAKETLLLLLESLISENALPSSIPPTKYSKRSMSVSSSSVERANGESSIG